MKRTIRLWIGAVLLPVLISTPCLSADYFSSIKEAITNIELGSYDKANVSAARAVELDESSSLGHLTLGVIYMHASRSEDAARELKKASSARPSDWRPYYALGVLAAGESRWSDAKKYFAEAWKSPESHNELAGVNEYLGYVANGWKSTDSPSSTSPLAKEVAGIKAYRSGDFQNASVILGEVVNTPAPLGFEESRSPLASFDPVRPVLMPKGKLTAIKKNPSRSVPRVSGRVMLRADTSKTSQPSFVSFFVDDGLAGVTNYAPFEFEWNTRRYTNGMHQVRIEAKNSADRVISNKTVDVYVSNEDTVRSDPGSSGDMEGLEDQLVSAIGISESRKLAHYYLGRSYVQLKEPIKASEQLRYALAYQPDFHEAAQLLKQLNGSHPYREIQHGRVGLKEICLSFDDGPNERTEQLLDVLKKLDVHATFFLVGFMAESHPDLVRAMQAEGHDIENHTYDHYRLTDMGVNATALELAKGEGIIEAITGRPSLYFRPPGGHSTAATRAAAEQLGLTGVFWSILCSPYEGAKYQQLADHVINNAKDGDVILMHNGEPGTMSVLPRIVSTLRGKGFKFVTIPEIDPYSKYTACMNKASAGYK